MQSTTFIGEVASKTESGMGVIAGTEQSPVLIFVKPMSDNSRAAVAEAKAGDCVLVNGNVVEAKVGQRDPYYVVEAYQVLAVNTAAAFNKITLTGRLGKRPELRHTGNNSPVTNLNVAVGRGDDTVWFQVTAWGRQAETACEYLDKGSAVAATGVLKAPRPWGDPPRVNIEMTAFYVEFLSPPRKEREQYVAEETEDYDEIPF